MTDFKPAVYHGVHAVARTALAFSCMRFVGRGMTGLYVPLAEGTFVAAKLLVGWIFIRSIILLLEGYLVPPALQLSPKPVTP